MNKSFSANPRVDRQPAFLLTANPWRESSLLAEMFSRDYGRVPLIARSARRRQSDLRGVLVPFVPLSVSWFGGETLKTLHRVEWLGGWPQPKNINLFSGLYINELMLKLTVRADPQPALYDALAEVLRAVCTDTNANAALRLFEWTLFKQHGSAPDLHLDRDGRPLDPEARYLAAPQQAFHRLDGNGEVSAGLSVSGAALCALRSGNPEHPDHLAEILRLNRLLADHLIPEGLTSRRIMQQMQHFR